MSKKAKIVVSILVAAALLMAGGAVTVMGQDEPAQEGSATTTEAGAEGLLARVAGILGISQDELVSAFQKARREMQDEAVDRALDKAVEQGLIDEVEAADIKGWLAQKPESVEQFMQRRARLLRQSCGRLMLGFVRRW